MARIDSLNILVQGGGDNELLAETYGKVIRNFQKGAVSARIKNNDLSGDPTSGSVEAKRFVNAGVKNYGSARQAGKGDAVEAKPIPIAIDQDKEIVEELEEKDTKLYGVDGLVEKRTANHGQRMISHLDTVFFATAYSAAATAENGIELDLATGNIEDICEAVIQALETVSNDFVDGVNREDMVMVMSPKWYGKLRNQLDKCERSNIDTSVEEFYAWHGVETMSCNHMPKDGNNAVVPFMVMVRGAVAQPVTVDQYEAEKIPLSNSVALELYFSYGTKAVSEDLIFYPVQEEDDTEGGGGAGEQGGNPGGGGDQQPET